MISKLLSYLYSAFDKDPQATLALRVSHAGKATWTVSGRKLTVGTKSTGAMHVYDLTGYTFRNLYQSLKNIGFTVTFSNPSLERFNASILIDGSGSEDKSNGDHIYAYQSPLWSILDVYSKVLGETYDNAVINAIQMAYFHKADGFWLDQWGVYFSIVRKDGESDSDYRNRLIKETTKKRSNRYAIQNALKDETGFDIVIHELWEDIFTLDVSSLSGGHCFHDGEYYTWGTIEAICYNELTDKDRADIERIINRDRMAGILYEGINQSVTTFIQSDIELSKVFDYEENNVTWKMKETWEGNWSDTVTYGFNVSVGLS